MKNNIQEIIYKVRDLGGTIKLYNDNLKIISPKNSLTAEIVNEIKEFKADIISFLKQTEHDDLYNSYTTIKPATVKDHYPLSSAQKRIFIIQQMDLNSVAYNVTSVMSLHENTSHSEIEKVFQKVLLRHESFRTSFSIIDGNPAQKIHEKVNFKLENYSIKDSELQDFRNTYIQPFDLSKAPLLRCAILNLESGEKKLIVDTHHIISDGVSHVILEKEFRSIYAGVEQIPLRLQYKDYSEWQNSSYYKDNIKEQKEYWLNKLKGEIPTLNLPTDYIRPKIRKYDGATVSFIISADETYKVKKFSQENNLTLFMFLLSVFSILLSKLSNL